MNPLMLMSLIQPLMQLAGAKKEEKVQGPQGVFVAVLTGDLFTFIQALGQLAQGGHCPPAATPHYPDDTPTRPGYPNRTERDTSRETLEALRTLRKNYGKADVAAAWLKTEDGLISRNDLAVLSRDPRISSELKKAVEHLLETPGLFEQMSESQGPFGESEPFITRSNLDDAITRLQAKAGSPIAGSTYADALGQSTSGLRERTSGATRAQQHTPDAQAGSEVIRHIIQDPSLSIEEKLRQVLLEVMRTLDQDTLNVSAQMADMAEERESLPSGEDAKDSELNRGIDKLSDRLQSLSQKRKAMFELLSNMTANFGEMSMRAITNLGMA